MRYVFSYHCTVMEDTLKVAILHYPANRAPRIICPIANAKISLPTTPLAITRDLAEAMTTVKICLVIGDFRGSFVHDVQVCPRN